MEGRSVCAHICLLSVTIMLVSHNYTADHRYGRQQLSDSAISDASMASMKRIAAIFLDVVGCRRKERDVPSNQTDGPSTKLSGFYSVWSFESKGSVDSIFSFVRSTLTPETCAKLLSGHCEWSQIR